MDHCLALPRGRSHKTRRCRGVTYPESYITKYLTNTKITASPYMYSGRGQTWGSVVAGGERGLGSLGVPSSRPAPPAVTGLTTGLLWSGLDNLLNLDQAPSRLNFDAWVNRPGDAWSLDPEKEASAALGSPPRAPAGFASPRAASLFRICITPPFLMFLEGGQTGHLCRNRFPCTYTFFGPRGKVVALEKLRIPSPNTKKCIRAEHQSNRLARVLFVPRRARPEG